MILVTGAAGTVGTEVVKGLRAHGTAFRVGYRNRRTGSSAPAVTPGPGAAGRCA